MGKAKPVKKSSSSPIKISTSLFKRKATKSYGGWSGTDDSNSMTPSPPPKKSTTKSKTTKSETKPKTSSSSSPKKGSKGSSTTPKASTSKAGNKSKPIPDKKPAAKKGKSSPSSSEKEKAGVKGKSPAKGGKKPPVKPTLKTAAKNQKDKRKSPPKTTKAAAKQKRKRSKSSSTATSSASSTTTMSSSASSSRTPSPVQPKPSPSKSKATQGKSESAKKPPVKKKVPAKTTEKEKEKGKAASKGKKPKVVAKVSTAKPKVKPVKPKAKLRRMASLNAKAILEASFNNESPEKKQKSPAGTPTKPTAAPPPKMATSSTSTSTGTSMDDADPYASGDFKPLTLLFSGSQPELPKAKSVSPGGAERKRKSSVVKNPPNNGSGGNSSSTSVERRDSISASIENSIAKAVNPGFRRVSASIGTSTATTTTNPPGESTIIRRYGETKGKKSEKGKSKSPTPKKKTKVASSSVSTSTSPFEHEEIAFQPKSSPPMSKRGLEQGSGAGSSGNDSHHTTTDRRTLHAPFSVQPSSNTHHHIQPSQHHSSSSGKQGKNASGHSKEKATKSSTPVAHFGYQPAGPLIEPHKTVMTGSVPVGLLPDSVRIPADLKVTYQTHPPASTALTHSTSSFTSQGSKGSSSSTSTKHASDHAKNQASGSSSTSASKSNKQILHQPYKSAGSSSSTPVPSASVTSTRVSSRVEVQQSSSFASHPGSFTLSGSSLSSSLSSGGSGFLSQQSQIGGMTIGPSHHIPPGQLVPAAGGSDGISGFASPSAASAAGVYYGYGAGGSHSSPFTPSKYPFVAPDYRPPQHSNYPSSFMYAPGAPQPSPGYFMAPFYSPPIAPSTAPGSLGFLGNQSRPLLSAHHPGGGATTAAYYQSGPPLAHHPASNYYVAGPSLQPSHHSIQPATAPGRVGLSPPNRSSQTTCPSTSSPPNNSSTSNSNSTTPRNNNKTNKQLPPRRQPPSASSASPRQALDLAINKAKTPATTPSIKNKRKECSTPALGADPPKALSSKSLDISQARQLESAKTFTEQYSLPDDITITPIIMCAGNTASYYGNGLKSPPIPVSEKRKRDIVQVIDPRSGATTTIAKHISTNNIKVGASPSNVSQVKPNNAGNVGKISPDLDVIVIGRGGQGATNMKTTPASLKKVANRRPSATQMKVRQPVPSDPFTQGFLPNKNLNQRSALSTCAVVNTSMGRLVVNPSVPNHQGSGGQFPVTNFVQPLPQLVRGENKTNTAPGKTLKRKPLDECIDRLKMTKKMKVLCDTNISVRTAGSLAGIMNTMDLSRGNNSTVLTYTAIGSPSMTSVNEERAATQQKSGGKDKHQRQKPGNPAVRRVSATASRRSISTDSDVGATIINGPEAVAAASALVIPLKANGSTVHVPVQFGLDGRSNPGMVKKDRDSLDSQKRKSLKMKILGGKVITRSATQNSKVKTRGKTNPSVQSQGQSQPATTSSSAKKGPIRNRQVLIRTKKADTSSPVARIGGNKTTKNKTIFPSYFNTLAANKPGNGSSTLTTSNNHVILRIPKSSNPGDKGGRTIEVLDVDGGAYSQMFSDYRGSPTTTTVAMLSTSGNMTLNAMKKRAIVKPLSPSLVNNGSIHSMPMANKKALPTYPHPRWSNGWTFEGDSFEGKVYLRNDDQPVLRRCYSSMRHDGGDVIRPRDCVLLKSGARKTDLPFVAKVAALWENPLDGEMMFSLLWYYRPEHTEVGRSREDMNDEIFASKHRDCNSVATIEDRCYVLTYNEYCRYKKRMKQLQEGVPGSIYPPMVPLSTNSSETTMAVTNFAVEIATAVWSGITAPKPTSSEGSSPSAGPSKCNLSSGKVSPEVVFFCRKVYDYRQKRMLKNPS